jgi:ABC-type glycerol-3-phosphate transport system permease component
MIKKALIYTILSICGLTMIVPFLWMLSTSVKSQLEVNKGNIGFIPMEYYTEYDNGENLFKVKILKEATTDSMYVHIFNDDGEIVSAYIRVPKNALTEKKALKFHWKNYINAWTKVPFARYFINTMFVSICMVAGVLITGALAAYAFARMNFFGREFIFYLFISMMMVPQPIYLIPSYIMLHNFGWLDTYMALIIPWLANIFTIFLLRQQFKTIPQELFDAAAIDGCSRFGILWKIVLPLSKSVLVTAGIFAFITSWNSFMWPLVMINKPELRVLQVGLSYFSQEASSQTTLLMAASTFSILPLIILFLFAQKQIMSSFVSSGLKG